MRLTERQFPASNLLPFLNSTLTIDSFHLPGTDIEFVNSLYIIDTGYDISSSILFSGRLGTSPSGSCVHTLTKYSENILTFFLRFDVLHDLGFAGSLLMSPIPPRVLDIFFMYAYTGFTFFLFATDSASFCSYVLRMCLVWFLSLLRALLEFLFASAMCSSTYLPKST